MNRYTPDQMVAYSDGLDAARRAGKYEGATSTPNCPFPADSPQSAAWWDGFGDGTEDLIAGQRSDD